VHRADISFTAHPLVFAGLFTDDGPDVQLQRPCPRRHRARWPLLACATLLTATSVAQTAAAPASAPALHWEQARQRLEQVSDALAAADAGVRNKQELQEATRLLRLPEITGEVRRLQFQKTLTLPLGSLAPVAEAYGIDSPLSFTERDWRTRPVVTAVLPLYTGGVIPAAQRAASAASEQASAEREAQRQSLTVQLAQAYFGQRLAEQAVDVRRDVRDGLNRHLSDAEKLEREGFATRAQRLQATVARDKAEREYQKTLNDLATLQAALAPCCAAVARCARCRRCSCSARRWNRWPASNAPRRHDSRRSAACRRWLPRPNRACACSRPS